MRSTLIVAALLFTTSLAAFGGKEESLQGLIARAESAKPQDQPALYTEIAERQVASADQLYAAGKAEEASAAVQDVIKYSDKARDAAVKTGKKLKQTEISVRKMAAKLRDVKRGLAFDDQPPVQAAIEHLETLRTDLQAHMFGSKGDKR
ncbi:MAG: hypothetical protein LAO03_16225 [Acidobacteriia bacterium]|nr:hypothetical protein [Terriglobia bacterium]